MIAACLISVLILALAGVTRFGAHLQGAWHMIYVASAGASLYFNLLLGVVGASSQTEPSLLLAQLAVVLPFVGVTVAIILRFRRQHWPTASSASSRTGQVLVNQQTVLDEDIAFKKTQ
jgi:uncharacterized membrane protein